MDSLNCVNQNASLQIILKAIIIDDEARSRKALQIALTDYCLAETYTGWWAEDRLKILNQLNKETPSVNIVDLFNENHEPSGTRVKITIPV